jgi:hypothetical protein
MELRAAVDRVELRRSIAAIQLPSGEATDDVGKS